jgi:preprotein translocase subunit SecY
MIKTIVNAWKIADLRKKLIFTALMVLVFRIGCSLPVPFVNIAKDGILPDSTANNFMTYLSMMTGNAFNYGTLFAMSVTPYINASIIIQLLTVAIPPLQKLSQEGEEGRRKIGKITRYSAAALALMQSTAYFFYIRAQGFIATAADGSRYTGFAAVFQAAVIILCYTAGAAFIIWLGDLINEKGVGNGISIILFAGIVARIPTIIYQLYSYLSHGGVYYALSPLAAIFLILMIAYIVWMDNAERRIPVQYAKRVVGRKMYGGQSSHIPIKVNMCGVLPIIFASSILSLPPTVGMFVQPKQGSFWETFLNWFNSDSVVYGCIYFVLIIFFAYFYAAIQYNPIEMSNNIRNQGGVIPGIRAGRPTSEFITKVLNRLTLLGALLLSVVAIFPIIFTQVTTAVKYPMNISLGGTSIIIVVGVALETVKQLESQMMMRHYKGFLD